MGSSDDLSPTTGPLPSAAAAAGENMTSETEKYLVFVGVDVLLILMGERIGGWGRLLTVIGSVGLLYNLLGLTDELEGGALLGGTK